MLTVLIEKMVNSSDHARWSEHGSFAMDFSDDPAMWPDLRENSLWADHVIEFSAEIPMVPEIELDVPVSPDSEVILESQFVESSAETLAWDVDAEGPLEDCELEIGLQANPFQEGAFQQMMSRQSALASVLIHAFMIFLAAFAATTHAKGTYGCGGESIMVRVVAHEECVPVEETPASIDSAASSPSVAGKPNQHKKVEKEDKREQAAESRERQVDATHEYAERERKDPDLMEKKEPKEKSPHETERGDGPVNSVASLPSVASEERRILSAGGSDMEDFQSRILAAIREAIHFPKEALEQKKHGETVVQFTVNRDGSVSNLWVKQESGSRILDQAALTIIRRASRNFPAIPDRLAREYINYVVPIFFKEKRSRAANN